MGRGVVEDASNFPRSKLEIEAKEEPSMDTFNSTSDLGRVTG
jgi:hypothetical protein